MRKKIFCLLMVLAMVMTTVPAAAFASEVEQMGVNSVNVTFSYSKENDINYGPKELNVSAGLAASYGVGEVTSVPTVLDAVVAAHVDLYGKNFAPETAEQYVNDTLTTLFKDNGYGGHIVNSHYSQEYACKAELNDNDIVDLFLYSSNGSDSYAAFYQDSSIVKSVQVETGVPVKLTAKGFGIMNASGGETWEPLEKLSVGVFDATTSVFTDKQIKTGADGSFEINFDTPGEYILVAKNSAATPVVPAWCKVNVLKGMTPEEMQQVVAADKEALAVTYTDGDSINLPVTGESGKTKITWASDKPNVISETGKVVKQLSQTEVNLTATIQIGNTKDTKVFNITVPALNNKEMKTMLDKAVDALMKVNALKPVEYTGGSGGLYAYESAVLDINILTKAQGIVDAAAPGVKVTLKSVNNGTEFIAADGKITYPKKDKGDAEITLVLTIGSESIEKKIAGIVVPVHNTSKTEAVKELMDKTTLETVLNGQEQGKVTKTLKLPVGKSYGLGITWESDNEAIRIDKGTSSSTEQSHKIIRPALGEKDAEVTLTATFDYSEMAKNNGLCDGGPMPSNITKTFKVTVPAITASESEAIKLEVEKAVASVMAEGITACDADGKDTKEPADLNNIIYDLHLYDFDIDNQYYKNGVRLSWSSTNPAIQVNTLRGKVIRPTGKENATGQVIVTATKEGITASKSFDTVVLASDVKPTVNPIMKSAINKIIDGYAAKEATWWGSKEATWWHAAIMGADKVLNGKDNLNAEQKQAFANQMIEEANKQLETPPSAEGAESARVNVLANAANGLSAMGFDINKLGTINGTSVELGNGLSKINVEGAKRGYFDTIAPYVYIATNQGEFGTDKVEADLVKFLMEKRTTDGSFSEWGVDSHAMVMQGLAMSNESAVKEACEKGVEVLANEFNKQSGNTFGSPNSDSMAVIALAAMGVNPDTDTRFVNEKGSLLDGLLSYLTTDKNGFSLTQGGKLNDIATYQGTLALLAAKKVTETKQPVNVFDFTSIHKVPVKVNNPGGTEELPKPPEENNDITVTVSINGDSSIWLPPKSVKIKEGSTVGNAFVKAIDGTGITQVGAESGYVKSITYKGVTLAEFSKGPNSGWLYKVNGTLPTVGINSYEIKNGDSITFYFTEDWKKDPDAGAVVGPQEKPTVSTEGPAGSAVTTTPTEVTVVGDTAKVTVKPENMTEAIKQAKENKSKEIILNVKAVDIKKATKIEAELDTSVIRQLAKDTTTSLAIKSPLGKAEIGKELLAEIASKAKGSKVIFEVTQNADKKLELTVKSGTEVIYTSVQEPEKDKTEEIKQIKEQLKTLKPTARSVKTAKKNVIVRVNLSKTQKEMIENIEAAGYDVKYHFYRSTKKGSKYESKLKSEGTRYVNTVGKKGRTYYYKARVQVYDENGKLIAKTTLKNCKYAARVWTK